MFEYVKEYLKINEVEYKENFKAKYFSAVKIGGAVRIAAYPSNENAFLNLISFLTEIRCKYKVIGKASNVLFPDENYDGVIVFTGRLNRINVSEDVLNVDSGASLPRVAALAMQSGISGFEEISGIPGSVGAAVVGNAGAFGADIASLVKSLRVFCTDTRRIERLKAEDLSFGYRKSNINGTNVFVLSVEFKGKRAASDYVKSRALNFALARKKSQPIDYPSLGCTFKKTNDGISAGALMDACGLKGYSVGDASISEKHAGFIVNLNSATAKDYISLAGTAEFAVFRRFGVSLEKEIEIIE